ncbi:hypothetical protein SARC_12225 [Sphaeroforma arctica JP610]|uniref:SnoaL-like domain-containing protein n=1 Tax=Sphaeroforma arctica JP610 TaxID=667725 RepID=A0A0L0FEQ5_9EUKA|nr:hypothetical protein SARC_12225 [Sphaeroforma arctica JP610]KNC75247.1 hypothetical protein SARC_12225 [Sphaeroforma arctica JP610]|eukprot:XP_014149149.1 hypothetical protein SARC_12225 [Sphaeroforma arctica JP610]
MDSKTAVNELYYYIAAFNAQDLDGIRDHLDSDIQVWVDGRVVACGIEEVLPSYKSDFEHKTFVRNIRAAEVVHRHDMDTIGIRIGLQTGSTDLTVVYTFRTVDMKQVPHEITVDAKK